MPSSAWDLRTVTAAARSTACAAEGSGGGPRDFFCPGGEECFASDASASATRHGATRTCDPSADRPSSSVATRAIAADADTPEASPEFVTGAASARGSPSSSSDHPSDASSSSSSSPPPDPDPVFLFFVRAVANAPAFSSVASRTICAFASVWCSVLNPIFPTIACFSPTASPAAFTSAAALSTRPYSCSASAASSRFADAIAAAAAASALELGAARFSARATPGRWRGGPGRGP